MQKLTSFRNMPYCVVIIFNSNGLAAFDEHLTVILCTTYHELTVCMQTNSK